MVGSPLNPIKRITKKATNKIKDKTKKTTDHLFIRCPVFIYIPLQTLLVAPSKMNDGLSLSVIPVFKLECLPQTCTSLQPHNYDTI